MTSTDEQTFLQRYGSRITTVVLMLAVAGLLAALSLRFDYSADWTANNRNSLTQPSRTQLRSMPAPLVFTAFVSQDEAVRREIQAWLSRYLREKDNARLDFVDPVANPQEARDLGISANGEIVIEYQGRRENLALYQLSEQAITGALQRLSFGGETIIRFVQGHGERQLDDQEIAGYARIAKELRDKGLRVEPLNLAQLGSIPPDTSMLVLAGPRTTMLPGEVQMLRDYLARGGNLLWLADPESPAALRNLAEELDIELLDGTVVYPDYQMLQTGHPAMALVAEYPPAGVTRGLQDITLFPFAAGLQTRSQPGAPSSGGWRIQPFLTTAERSWLETGPMDEEIEFRSADGDLRGPLMIGLTLERSLPAEQQPDDSVAEVLEAEDREQRVAVVADSDFLANGYLYNIGNLQLGVNIFQWLAHRDTQLSIVVPPAPDTHIYLPLWASIVIGFGFVFVLPAGLIGFGLTRWWMRRRR